MSKASPKYDETIAERQAKQKEDVVAYFAEIPIYKHAAAFAGIHEDTLALWRKEDAEFSDRLEKARAEFVRRYGKRSRPEFLLERLDKDNFAEKKTVTLEFDPAKKLLEEFGLLEGRDGREDDDAVQGSPESTSQDTE